MTNAPTRPPTERGSEFADDLLRGASEIAQYLFNDRTKRRAVYYLAAHSRLPVFRLGTMLCARRSVLLKWIAAQEERLPPDGKQPD